MRTPLVLLKYLAKAFADAIPGGSLAVDFVVDVLPDVAKDAWDWWSKDRNAEERKADVEEVVKAEEQEIKEAVAKMIMEFAADKNREVQEMISLLLTQVPSMVRKSMRRPADPTGRTVSPHREPKNANDLLAFLPSKPARFKPGDRPLSSVDWELVELLGIGGFGEVWKARNPHMTSRPPAALKFCLDTAALKVLRNEAAVLNRVMKEGKHPGIVELQQTYLSAETPCLEYEYVAGGDLAGLINEWHRSSGEFKPEKATDVIFQLAGIVGSAHCSNPPLVHRDLKPANILVQNTSDNKLVLKVADFGIGGAAMSQAVRESTLGATRGRFLASAVQGAYTPLYASPQQMRGEHADPRDDVFALGVIWYQMLTGDLTTGRPGGSRWRSKLAQRGLPQELSELLEMCFEDDPEDRPADALALAQRLDFFLSQTTLAFLRRGNSSLKNGEWEQAIAEFSEAIRLNPKNAEAFNLRGRAFHNNGDYDRAISDFTEVIAQNAQNADAYCSRGLAQSKRGQLSQAIDDYNQAIRLDPQNADAYCNLGIVYFRRGDSGKATANYKMAIRFNSNHAEAYYRLGIAYEKRKKVGRAINCYAEAIRLNPNFADAYWNRAVIYEEQEKYARAISDYSQVIRLDPTNSQAHSIRGDIFRKLGVEDERAISDYSQIIRLKPTDPNAYWNRGNFFRDLGQYDRAKADYKEAIRLDPTDLVSKAKCVAHFCKKGDASDVAEHFDEAVNYYSLAIEIDPENQEIKRKFADAAYFLDPQDNETKLKYATACCSRGDDYFEKEDFENALPFYSKAIELNPEDKDAREKCAAAYRNAAVDCCKSGDESIEKDDYKKAIEFYTSGIEFDGQNAIYYRKRGDAFLQSKQYENAIADFTEAIRLDSRDGKAYLNRAIAHRVLSKEAQALDDERVARAITQGK